MWRPHRDANQPGDSRLLDSQPLRIELQKSDATREQHANQSQQCNKIKFPVLDLLEQAPAQWKRQRHDQGCTRPKGIIATELHQNNGGDNNADQQVN